MSNWEEIGPGIWVYDGAVLTGLVLAIDDGSFVKYIRAGDFWLSVGRLGRSLSSTKAWMEKMCDRPRPREAE